MLTLIDNMVHPPVPSPGISAGVPRCFECVAVQGRAQIRRFFVFGDDALALCVKVEGNLWIISFKDKRT